MIGGVDVIFDTGLSSSRSLDIATCTITRLWTSAVFQDAINGDIFTSQQAIPFESVHELLCYRDAASHQQWDALGAEPSTADTMIHLLAYDPGRLTVVVDDDKRGDASIFLDALRQVLADRMSPLKNSA
jgi:hypothetical protein